MSRPRTDGGRSRLEVCPVEDLAPGDRVIVEEGELSIGVFNVDGEYHALLNSCMHQYGPVCRGNVRPGIDADQPGLGERVDERWSEEDLVIECPWHGWSYDLRTGEHTGEPDVALPTFPVVVEDGTVYVER
mgnify:CR=1 FL=1